MNLAVSTHVIGLMGTPGAPIVNGWPEAPLPLMGYTSGAHWFSISLQVGATASTIKVIRTREQASGSI